MFAFTFWLVGFLLSVPLVASGVAKVMGERSTTRLRQHLRISKLRFRLLGMMQILSGGLLVMGLMVAEQRPWVGVLGALLVIATAGYLIRRHRQVKDTLTDYTMSLVAALVGVAYVLALVLHSMES